MACYPEKVFESEILDVVAEAIRQQARCVVDAQRMMEQQKKSQEAAVSLLRKKAKKLEALQRELTQRIEKLYEDAVIDNLLSRDAYTVQKARLVEQRDDAHMNRSSKKFQKFISSGLTLADLRHSVVYALRKGNCDIKTIQAWLGHSDITTTLNVYGHVLGSDMDKLGQVMDSIFSKGSKAS